jgi:formylglycine-generating enzyme required for sulfatase activity
MIVDPNAVSAREAMGLPERFVGRVGELSPTDTVELGLDGSTVLRALRVLEDQRASLAARIAAGNILALLGDPRIDAGSPRMIDVPGGTARLGTDAQDVPSVVAAWAAVGVRTDWILKECPVYEMELASFRIARYPVTNFEYREFLAATGWPELPTAWRFGSYPGAQANHPVWGVDEAAVSAYIEWVSGRTGRQFRLPSEAEWEFAASGGTRRAFPWGETFDPQLANTVEAGPLWTTPVGAYAGGRSPFGLDDVAGNVEELVADAYAPYPGGALVADDLWQSRGAYRVTRGGSFTRYGDLARCQRRHGWYDRDIYAIGFRLAETPPDLDAQLDQW